MNDYISNSKINLRNWKEPETEERFPEFYKKIRESDAWNKYLIHLIMVSDAEQNIPKNEKTKAWNDFMDAKRCLVEELNEKLSCLCDGIVGVIISNDLRHWRSTEYTE